MVLVALMTKLEIIGLDEKLSDEHHRQDDTEDTQRIGHGRGQSSTSASHACMLQGLLRRTKGGVLVVAPQSTPIISLIGMGVR